MIVRTYGRRNRCMERSLSDSSFDGGEDPFLEPLSQETPPEIYSVTLSSQDSAPWSFDSYTNGFDSVPDLDSISDLPPRPRKTKKQKNSSRESVEFKNPNLSLNSRGLMELTAPTTSTLMEAQEFGEMMEHVDEVNFALDGLRPGQPARILRGSLLSLLTICSTVHQRRLLRTQGMVKRIVDAILTLSFDDSPSTLAASALLYVLASDGQEEHLLDSPSCIKFLLNLLNPPLPRMTEDKIPTIGQKLLMFRWQPSFIGSTNKKSDSGSAEIISKVQEILFNCKEIRSATGYDTRLSRPELSAKWIALLTIEKACLSAVSLQETSGTVRKVGGNFKETLRELGGLDTVFDVAASCHCIMKRWSDPTSFSARNLKEDTSFILLLRCLKIMENATFLSKENQNHLLGMSRKLEKEESRVSFVGLVLSAIKILSDLSLEQYSSHSKDEKSCFPEDIVSHLSESNKGDKYGMHSSYSLKRHHTSEETSIDEMEENVKCQRFSSCEPYFLSSGYEASTSYSDVQPLKKGKSPVLKISLDGRQKGSISRINSTKLNGSKNGLGKGDIGSQEVSQENFGNSQDPFAFDEDNMELSKWELLSERKKVSRSHQSLVPCKVREDESEIQVICSNSESNNKETIMACEEGDGILGDCLLTAIKVLMNLTNDNPVGCQQIASCGGLDTMASLIVGHFQLFDSYSMNNQNKETKSRCKTSTNYDYKDGRCLSDQESDLLVAILGLLVNLVEKDGQNRSRLAAASVVLPCYGKSESRENRRDVIPFLCSIFLANQGAGEAAGDGQLLPWNDEEALLQGEHEAEQAILEAYAALVLAFLSTESKLVRESIANCLPDRNLKVLVPVLERFVAFHLTLNMISPETHTAVSEVIESCRVL